MPLSKDDRLIQSFEDPYLVSSTSAGHVETKKTNESLWFRMSFFQRMFSVVCCIWMVVLTGLIYSDNYPLASNVFGAIVNLPNGIELKQPDNISLTTQWKTVDIYWNWGGKPLACLLFFGVYITPMLQLLHWLAIIFYPLSTYRRNSMIQGLKKVARFALASIFLGFTELFYVKWNGVLADPDRPITIDFSLRSSPKPGTSLNLILFFCAIVSLDLFDQLHTKLFDFKPQDYGKSYVSLISSFIAFILIFIGLSEHYMRIKVAGVIGSLIEDSQTDVKQSIFDWFHQSQNIHGEPKYNFWFFVVVILVLILPLTAMFMKILRFWFRENEQFSFIWGRLSMFYVYDILVLLFLLRRLTGPQQDDYFTEIVKPPPCFNPQHPIPEGMKCQQTDCSLEAGWYLMLASAVLYYFGDVYLYLRHCCTKNKDEYEIENYVEP